MSDTKSLPGIQPPLAPASHEASGLSLDMLVQLALKTLLLSGELTGVQLAARLGLPFRVIEPALDVVKTQRQCEVFGGGMLGSSAYKYRITDAGRTRAALFLESNHYVGRAPVPLAQYQRYMSAFQDSVRLQITRAHIQQAFSHLVLNDHILDQIGPAINAGHSMFVYGPPGNGKTVIARAIRDSLAGNVAVPHALEVEGNIIRVFDPVTHESVAPSLTSGDSLDEGVRLDQRWVSCRRPMVMVGGELTLESLDLSFSPSAGFYHAPIQVLANGGVLVIDDFGRQACSPRDLLNRWIVPLESRVDFMSLQTGQKSEVPFSALVVFATNLKPSNLMDEAFVRRIRYKILAESPTSEEFVRIFEQCCRERDLDFDRQLPEQLLQQYYRPRNISLRGCQPRDLIEHSLARADYLEVPRRLTYELLEGACASYFIDEAETPVVEAQRFES